MKTSPENIIISKSEKETIAAGKEYAESIKPGEVIGLKGNLGSGKTQFVKGISSYYNVKDIVNSPTFLIVNQYEGADPATGKKITVNHFDLYRLKFKEELETIGFEDYINEKSICLIEWSRLAEEFLGMEFREVNFDFGEKETERIIKFTKK
ncbi:MAG: tRNA (adenosine(37)-N6)-threonylcarbamoyltransferase complex ATPase subunit type 1 TsaE [Ignavibacteriae bacterium]|nr:tRNA (adenosine(37)-N6)-threonylcarbamoyltransferase complex ATPase subunit type 1 TsaE [Ignavibacteriota bacterium]